MDTALDQLIETELDRPEIRGVTIMEDSLGVDLRDRRTIVAPLLWYPRLAYATDAERQDFEIRRNMIYWQQLDEEVSVRAMLLGRTSGESRSLWKDGLHSDRQKALRIGPPMALQAQRHSHRSSLSYAAFLLSMAGPNKPNELYRKPCYLGRASFFAVH